MSSVITGHSLFGPKPSKAETKADTTDRIARGIIGAEAEKREIKTARLKRARLEREARQDVKETARAKTVASRRARSSK